MKLRISMHIKYKSTLKEIVLAELKQCYGSKIVHLLQDNEITKNSPKALKDAKTWELQGADHQGPQEKPVDPTSNCSRYALSGHYFNNLFRAPYLVAMPLTSQGAIVYHIQDTLVVVSKRGHRLIKMKNDFGVDRGNGNATEGEKFESGS